MMEEETGQPKEEFPPYALGWVSAMSQHAYGIDMAQHSRREKDHWGKKAMEKMLEEALEEEAANMPFSSTRNVVGPVKSAQRKVSPTEVPTPESEILLRQPIKSLVSMIP